MQWISGFWAGAQDFGWREHLEELAGRVGGFDLLESGGEEALVAAGVRADRARCWAQTPARRTRGRALIRTEAGYPSRLRGIPGAPPVLFVEGDPSCLEVELSLAVVGTRACTAYGRAVARHLGGAWAAAGGVVVSGLARGIDAEAHKGAVRAGLSVAVLAHGLDHTAPASNRRLREALVDSGGCVVSTWPDEVGPLPWRFPKRNRWIAALADVVAVVEAPVRSGALHTAAAAAELNRELVVVPGRIGDATSAGCNQLLEAGALPLVDVEAFVGHHAGSRSRSRSAWLGALFAGRSLDEASALSGRSVAELLSELSLLELRGEVVRLPGQRYAPAGFMQ